MLVWGVEVHAVSDAVSETPNHGITSPLLGGVDIGGKEEFNMRIIPYHTKPNHPYLYALRACKL